MRAFVYALLAAITAMLLAPAPGFADWHKDAKEATIKYADDKKDEFVKDQAKAAILALYKKLYRSSADLALPRTLASVAISAPELNKLMSDTAEAYASGDPEKIREASQKVAVSFGQQLSKLASNSQTRKQLGAIIGSADKVKEVSAVLGNVAAGTDEGRRAAAEYVGQVLINLTPGAGIVGFYQSAYGAMKYGDDLTALLSQSAATTPPESVISPPTEIREPAPPESVSSPATSTPPDLTNSESQDNVYWTPPANDPPASADTAELSATADPLPADASSTLQAASF